jgi:hypothetical protein
MSPRTNPTSQECRWVDNFIRRVLLGDGAGRGQQLIEHSRVGRCAISAHLGWAWAVAEGTGEESTSGRQIPFLGYQDVDDLAILVDRPIQVDPAPGDFDISFIDEPPITLSVPAGPARINQQRGEPLHPVLIGREVVFRDVRA